ncbi:MAG: efflux RND transporter periplasmic adaptor subunit [Chitinophagales bacterium]
MRYSIFILISIFQILACKEKQPIKMAGQVVYYTCAMHPQIIRDKPGKCPICKMELIEIKKDSPPKIDEIELTARQMQLGNIGVDTIGNGIVGNTVMLNAIVNIDQQKTSGISSRVSGRIEKLYFKNVGDYVQKGAKLFEIYSEELNNAKQEYLLALEKQRVLDNSVIDFAQLIRSAKNKLLLWGMSEGQMDELQKNGKADPLTTFYSNSGGYISSLEFREGDYITEGETLVRLADISALWVEAQVYSAQLLSININNKAIVEFPDMPGKKLKGKIEFINPEINTDTRINLVRISVPNTGNILKPGMLAYVTIQSDPQSTLSLPVDAVIRDSHGASVWLQSGVNKFKYVMVELGRENGDRIEIRTGLKTGDIVVISGAYLLNSEYIFKQGANPMEGMDMSNMKM